MNDDSYLTLAGESSSSIRIERSEFIAFAFHVRREEEFQERLTSLQKEYFDATHHCWGWRLFEEGGGRARSSDAGEPAGTAGAPILSAIEGNLLFDAGVVVVRYFGGIKLGTGGLSRAYRQAARAAIASAPLRTEILYQTLVVEVPFDAISAIYRTISPPDVVLAAEEYGERNLFRLQVRRSMIERVRDELREKRLNVVEEGER